MTRQPETARRNEEGRVGDAAAAPGPGMSPGSLLRVDGLCCRRGGQPVFSGVDFELRAGGALALTGGNGRGKTSMIRILAGLSPPAAGRVLWDGADALSDLRAHAARLSYVGHRDPTPPPLSVREILAFYAALAGRPDRLDKALATFELHRVASSPGRALSAGWRRRVNLARLRLQETARRPLWLLDEPASGLDAAARSELQALIAAHREQGGMVLFSTHEDIGVPGAVELTLTGPGPARPAQRQGGA